MSKATDDLTLRAAHLARTAPESWQRFLEAFSIYTNEQTTNCIGSSLEELPRSQGRAQIAAQLHALLANCLQSADKIERKP